MNYDEWGEVINGEETYTEVADRLKKGEAVLLGWTDGEMTHFDILLKYRAHREGTNIQGGVRASDLFVSIMRRGAFGFEIDNAYTHEGYYAEKLGGGLGSTAPKLAQLLNNIREKIWEK